MILWLTNQIRTCRNPESFKTSRTVCSEYKNNNDKKDICIYILYNPSDHCAILQSVSHHHHHQSHHYPTKRQVLPFYPSDRSPRTKLNRVHPCSKKIRKSKGAFKLQLDYFFFSFFSCRLLKPIFFFNYNYTYSNNV